MKLAAICILFIFSACSNEIGFDSEKLKVNEADLSAILADFHLMEGHINKLELNEITNSDTLSILKELIFNKHQINEADFNATLNYYSNYPENYRLLYTKVKDQLIDLELKLPDIEEEEEEEKQDSSTSNINKTTTQDEKS